MNWPLIIVSSCIALLLIRAVTTTVHELGHAVASYILTKQPVVVFLGSYGDEQHSTKILSGKFEVWLRFNLLKWRGGLCRHVACPARQNSIIVLAGPFASLLLFAFLLPVYLVLKPEGLQGALLLLFCIWSGFVFIRNIVPFGDNVVATDGSLFYNDGTMLRMLYIDKKMPADYKTAAVHFEAGRYAEAAVLLDGVIAQGTKNEFVYRMAVLTYMRLKDYRKADQVQKEQVARIGNLNAKDRINMALLKTLLGKYDEAISYYKHLLLTGGNNKYNLNNYGYTLTLVERYEDAIPYLDQAIAIDNDFAYAYSNRGFAYLMISNPEQGKIDNDRSLALDPANPYAYRNIGIYLFSRGLYEEALVQLNKAKELEEDLPLVDHYIGRTHDWLEL